VDFFRFFRLGRQRLACPDCWRFNQEEAEAAIEVVAADEPSNVDGSARRISAEDRLRTIRRQFAAHLAARHDISLHPKTT
jgi:hypothetical protein